MAGAFPGAVTNYTNPTSANYHDVPVGGRTQSQFLSDHSDDIEALATKLGISLAAPADTPVADRLLGSNASGKSGWMQLLAGMVPNSLITAAMLADTAALKKIGEVTLGSTATSISIQSIPATYRALRIHWMVRTDAGAGTALLARLNNDSGANYDYQVGSFAGSTAAAFSGTAANSIYAGECTRTASQANEFAAGYLDLLAYSQTAFYKEVIGRSARDTETYVTSSLWKSTAAINRIDLLPSSASNFIAGSMVTLWGLPA